MSVTQVTQFDVVPEQVDNFIELVVVVLDAMRHEPMLRQAMLHGEPRAPHRFTLSETWENDQDLLSSFKKPHRKRWHSNVTNLLTAERDVTISWEAPVGTVGAL